ncbi:MAG: YfhO family protein [Chloroflexota bacterium]
MLQQRLQRHWPLILLPLLILLFFHRLALGNLILARGDTFLYFYPYWEAAVAALSDGRLPHWNPYLFMGAPLLANSQVGFFYPLNWPLWLWFPIPYAVSATIVLHLTIAAWGTYLAARRLFQLERGGAFLAALLFALGGYLTAQVEHVNQLQGLAWLPWFLVALAPGLAGWQRTFLLALFFSLQLVAGHSQTSFISGVGVGVWLLGQGLYLRLGRVDRPALWSWLGLWGSLALGLLLALFMAAVQLLPTLELAGFSSREGGLAPNEVLSFSLHPLLLGRTFLPAYGQSLFSEYVAFFPLTGLILAVLGAWQWRSLAAGARQRPYIFSTLLLIGVGLFLALGVFNPANWLLGQLPGFNLFRVPARWLVLVSLGLSLLAGVGWEVVNRTRINADKTDGRRLFDNKRPLLIACILLIGLMGWSFLAQPLSGRLPLGPESPYELPSLATGLLWGGELLLLALIGLLWWRPSLMGKRPFQPAWLLLPLAIGVLFLASRSQPYHNVTTPAAYFDRRPPVARLLAETETAVPPGRLLSLSHIFFDLGGQAEIESIYRDQLPPEALYDYTIAAKQQEILAPNLPLVWGLPSVDGFDGGILPLASYSDVTALLLPEGVRTTDGRLREHLTAVPDARWLDLFNAQTIITDKVGDVWREGRVFFDRQHPVRLDADESVAVGHVPAYEATELWLLGGGEPGFVTVNGVQYSVNSSQYSVNSSQLGDEEELLWKVAFSEPVVAESLELTAESGAWQVSGLALVDERDETFQTLVPGPFRLIYSGDVKIYEKLDLLPRAVLYADWQVWPDETAVYNALRAPDFDPWQTAVVLAPDPPEPAPLPPPEPGTGGSAVIRSYEPEQVIIDVESDGPALLFLSDAHYPGWQAAIDGEETPIYRTNGLFRGVVVPAGSHEVVFTYWPVTYQTGRILTMLGPWPSR